MLSIEKYASALRKLFGAAPPPETLRFGRREHQLDQDAPSDVAVRERPERIGESDRSVEDGASKAYVIIENESLLISFACQRRDGERASGRAKVLSAR